MGIGNFIFYSIVFVGLPLLFMVLAKGEILVGLVPIILIYIGVPIYAGWFGESASIGMFDLMPNTKKLDKQIYNTMRLDYTIVLYYALFAYFVWVSPEKVNQKNWMMYVYGSPIFTGIIAFVIGILIPYGIYSGVKSLN